jgi:hypothetical protein
MSLATANPPAAIAVVETKTGGYRWEMRFLEADGSIRSASRFVEQSPAISNAERNADAFGIIAFEVRGIGMQTYDWVKCKDGTWRPDTDYRAQLHGTLREESPFMQELSQL